MTTANTAAINLTRNHRPNGNRNIWPGDAGREPSPPEEVPEPKLRTAPSSPSDLHACLRKIYSWRVPPNWAAADWYQEISAVAISAAWEAEQGYDPQRGVPLGAFVRVRVLARALTRYRQEWRFGLRCFRHAAEEGEPGGFQEGASAERSQTDPVFENLLESLDALPQQNRWLLEKLFWEGRTESELGRVLGISQQAVAKRKRLALHTLSNELKSFRKTSSAGCERGRSLQLPIR